LANRLTKGGKGGGGFENNSLNNKSNTFETIVINGTILVILAIPIIFVPHNVIKCEDWQKLTSGMKSKVGLGSKSSPKLYTLWVDTVVFLYQAGEG
jgi:hypothetical protein